MKRRYFFIPLALLVVLLLFAVVVRLQYTDLHNNIDPVKIYCADSDFGKDINDVSKEAKEVIGKSELVVKAHFTGKRTVTGVALYSTVKVEQVLKGDSSLNGKEICFVNLAMLMDKSTVLHSSTILPLYEGKTYLMLLKKVQFNPNRHIEEWQKNQYYAVKDSAECVLRIFAPKQTEIYGEDAGKSQERCYTVKEAEKFEMPAKDQKQLELYQKLKSRILQELHSTA